METNARRHPPALLLLPLALAALARPAEAHFTWIVPAESGVRVLLGETPRFDPKVDADLVAPAQLTFTAADGASRPLVLRRAANEWVAGTGGGRGTVHGVLDLGLTRRGEVPHLLVYYPKAIAGDPFGAEARDVKAPVELFVVGPPGAARIELRAEGRPVPNAELTLVSPDHAEKKIRTDAGGRTEVLAAPGRYGAWARSWLEAAGERDGAAYKQVRRYATLVFDLPGAAASAVPATAALPRAVSSFGAAAGGGSVYVYGGHVAKTHEYSREAVTGAFYRREAAGGWEELAAGPALQGTNLAVHPDRVFRVGGMRPENAPGQPSDTRSVADAAGYDPVAKRWEPLPPLPAPRSSHDLALVGDDLYVVGGWNMRGTDPAVWADTMLVLDVRAQPLRWESVPQPIQRRAHVTAVRGRLIYVLGGLDPEGKVLDRVDVYDTVAGTWSEAPALPQGTRNGFAPAACTLDNRVYASLGDGGLYVLDDAANAWTRIATTTARVAHRMVPDGDHRLLILGGAGQTGPLDVVESVDVRPESRARTAAR